MVWTATQKKAQKRYNRARLQLDRELKARIDRDLKPLHEAGERLLRRLEAKGAEEPRRRRRTKVDADGHIVTVEFRSEQYKERHTPKHIERGSADPLSNSLPNNIEGAL